MPVYNEEQTLGEIIETVLRQPLVAQLICVDDCSEDGTRAISERHAKDDPRLKVLH
ncbi:MAG: glycosyltransferase, partial [Terrimicrobiaceae bacterium]